MTSEAATGAGSIPAAQRTALIERFRRPMTLGNVVRDLPPGFVFAALVSLALVAASRGGFIWPPAICLGYIVIAFVAGVGRTFLVNFLRMALIVGGILFLARSATQPGTTVYFTIGALRVTRESVLAAGQFALFVVSVSGALILLFALVPIKKLMLALEQSGVTPRATFVVLASFQSIINLGNHSRVVAAAQESRGIEMGGSIPRKVKAFFAILAPVFLAAMGETEERALALDARAFGARARHTHLVTLRPSPVGLRILGIVLFLAGIASIVGAVTRWF